MPGCVYCGFGFPFRAMRSNIVKNHIDRCRNRFYEKVKKYNSYPPIIRIFMKKPCKLIQTVNEL